MSKRRITIDDLFRFDLVADPNISPDGNRIAFVVTNLNQEGNDYRSAVWMTDSEGLEDPVRYTAGQAQDFSPRWSPDGQYLAFVSNRSGSNQLHVMPTTGGEPVQLTSGPNPVSDINWAPDGASLLYVTKAEPDSEPESDTRVVQSLKYKFDGEGFLDGKPRHVHMISRDGGEPRQLTSGDWHSTQPVMASDGRTLAFVSNRTDDRESNSKSDIWTADIHTGEPTRVTPEDGVYTAPAWSPDGTKLAFTGHPIVEPYGPTTLDDLYVWNRNDGSTVRLLKEFDREPGNSAMSDMRFHLPAHRPRWHIAGDIIYTLVSDAGAVRIYMCELSGERTLIAGGDRDIQSFTISNEGVVAFAASTMIAPTDVFVFHGDGRERQVSAMNDPLLEEIELATAETITFESDPGVTVHGWLLKPPGMSPGVRYPAIIQVHGGPHGMYGNGFFHEMQLLAARGYVVLMANPRGSTGYGQEWVAGTLGDWGGADYRDVMASADALTALDYVDSSRIGITGGSYGGYMTNWVLGHTDRFKAAVSQRSTANRISLYGTSDFNMMYNDWEFSGTPYDNPEHYRERSPLTYVKNITTPLLLLHSENDLRCPISQSEELFVALKKLGREVEFVRFPDESHGLSRSGQPKHRTERLERICGWFDRYL